MHAETSFDLQRGGAWFGVIGGSFVAISISVVLNFLGFAVEITTIDPAGESPALRTLETGAWIWTLAAGVLALFAGGWVTGYVTGMFDRIRGAIHGIITWAVFSTLSLLLLMPIGGQLINGAIGAVDMAVSVPPSPEHAAGAVDPVLQAVQDVKEAIARASWWTFSYMALTLGAAAIGGFVGVSRARGILRESREKRPVEPRQERDPVTEEHTISDDTRA